MTRKPGRPAKPLEMPAIPQQDRPETEGLTWYLTAARRHEGMMDLVRRLQGLGYAAWCPLCVQKRTHARQTVLKVEPMYAPILFVGLRADQGIATMTKTIGVADVMRSDTRKPLSLPGRQLGKLWDELQMEGGAKMLARVQRGPWFKEGDKVKLKSGVWSEYPGVFSWCRGERVKILLDIAGREVPTETTLDNLVRA